MQSSLVKIRELFLFYEFMKKKWLLYFFSFFTSYAQDIKIENHFISIQGKKVAILKEVSYRTKYELFDLNENLLMRAKVVNCRNCKESNQIDIELTNANFTSFTKINTLETSFSRSKELLKALYERKILDENGVYPDNINSVNLQLRTDSSEPLISDEVKGEFNRQDIKIKGKHLYFKGLPIGRFQTIPSSFSFSQGKISFIKNILYDLDDNYIAAYCQLDINDKESNFRDPLLSDAFQWDRLILRNGKTFIYDDLSTDKIYQFLAEKAIAEGYKLEHDIKKIADLDYFDKNAASILKINERNDDVFFAIYDNHKGVGSFKTIHELSNSLNFKEGKDNFFFKSYQNDIADLIIHGYNGMRITLDNYFAIRDYIAFGVENSDVLEKIESLESVLDDKKETFEFREILFENKKYIIAKNQFCFFIKDKNKSRGLRLSSDKEQAAKNLKQYLAINDSLLNFNFKSLESLILLLKKNSE
ncbi:hypothetical protein [Flavobacterium oreochromis]|uniref:hypothetical protein n=1 Tax=Flavobacterium oreochromis TaxID=2906078 RepID=UPI00385AB9E9